MEYKTAKRMEYLPFSGIRAVMEKATKMQQAGEKVIHLEIGRGTDTCADLFYSAICNDYICRICYDGGSQLCSGNRCCGIHACSDSFYDDRISQIQYRAEYCCGFDTACLCI